MSDKKQTAVQYLQQTYFKTGMLYRTDFNKAIAMEREQIEDVAMYHKDSAVQIDCIRSYMKKNYGGQNESNN
jgi:hypothetical protein